MSSKHSIQYWIKRLLIKGRRVYRKTSVYFHWIFLPVKLILRLISFFRFDMWVITGVEGRSSRVKMLEHWFGHKPKTIQHFCMGFNPGATLSGKLLEAERTWGSISIGIGQYPLYVDGVIKSPSIFVNNEILEQDGSFKHKELSVLEQRLIYNQ